MYDISKFDRWIGRETDVEQVIVWRDLLKDFGAALLPFLIDEKFVVQIPTVGRLGQFKREAQKFPSRTFKTYPGAAWVLMAHLDKYAKLPDPFFKPGFLFPLEWRKVEAGRNGNHSELLPEALLELADKVKRQFEASGFSAEDFYLHPWHGFRDTVDFSKMDASFDSAWGALATGLFSVAVAGAKKKRSARWAGKLSRWFARRTENDGMLANWPFSSIAFDFENNQPTHVSHLSEKVAIVARYGGCEMAVAPNQYQELDRELRALEKCDKVKVCNFAWRWTGNLGKALISICRCNQLRTKRVRDTLCVMTLVAAGLGMGLYYEATRKCVFYYDSYVTHFGLPVGVDPVPEECVRFRYRTFKFEYSGIAKSDSPLAACLPESMLGSRRQLRRVVCVNSRGAEAEFENRFAAFGVVVPPVLECSRYDDGGVVREVVYKGIGGTGIKTLCYSDRGGIVNGLQTEKASDLSSYDFSGDTNAMSDQFCRSRICEYMIERDEEGRERKRLFSYLMRQTSDGNGVGGFEYEYDEGGHLIRCAHLNAEGRFDWTDRQVRSCFVGGHGSGILQTSYFDGSNCLAVAKNGLTKYREHLDGYGNVTNRVFLNKDGEPDWRIKSDKMTERSAGQSYTYANGLQMTGSTKDPSGQTLVSYRWAYDERGYCNRECLFDSKGRPMCDQNGVAIRDLVRDTRGRIVTEICRDRDERVCHDKHGVARYENVYDRNGNLVECRHYDESDKLADSDEGWAIMRNRYEKNRLTLTVYYDNATNEVRAGANHVACVMRRYDVVNAVSVRFFKTAECVDLEEGKSGYAGYDLEVDERGRVKQVQLLDARGKVSPSNDNHVAVMRIDYFDGLRSPLKFGAFCDGTVRAEIRYAAFLEDEVTPAPWIGNCGRSVSRVFLDAYGRTVVNCSCNADLSLTNLFFEELAPIMQNTYDKKGLLIKEMYFDKDGRPSGMLSGLQPSVCLYGSRHAYNDQQQKICAVPLGPDGNQDMNKTFEINQYDEYGRIRSISYRKGNAASENNGCYALLFKRDFWGRVTRKTGLDNSGNSLWSIAYCYDRVGNVTNECYYSGDNVPTKDFCGYFREETHYDRLHRKVCSRYYGIDGNTRVSGNSEFEWAYFGDTRRLAEKQVTAASGFVNGYEGTWRVRIRYANTRKNDEVGREYFDRFERAMPSSGVVVIESTPGFPDGSGCKLAVAAGDVVCHINKEGRFTGPVLNGYTTDEFVRERRRIDLMNALTASGGRFVVARKRNGRYSFVDYPRSSALTCVESAGVVLKSMIIPNVEIQNIKNSFSGGIVK